MKNRLGNPTMVDANVKKYVNILIQYFRKGKAHSVPNIVELLNDAEVKFTYTHCQSFQSAYYSSKNDKIWFSDGVFLCKENSSEHNGSSMMTSETYYIGSVATEDRIFLYDFTYFEEGKNEEDLHSLEVDEFITRINKFIEICKENNFDLESAFLNNPNYYKVLEIEQKKDIEILVIFIGALYKNLVVKYKDLEEYERISPYGGLDVDIPRTKAEFFLNNTITTLEHMGVDKFFDEDIYIDLILRKAHEEGNKDFFKTLVRKYEMRKLKLERLEILKGLLPDFKEYEFLLGYGEQFWEYLDYLLEGFTVKIEKIKESSVKLSNKESELEKYILTNKGFKKLLRYTTIKQKISELEDVKFQIKCHEDHIKDLEEDPEFISLNNYWNMETKKRKMFEEFFVDDGVELSIEGIEKEIAQKLCQDRIIDSPFFSNSVLVLK